MPDRPVREMIHRAALVQASADDTVRAAAKAMAEQVCGSILVMEGEHLVGIFTERDLLTRVVAAARDPDQARLRDVMTRDPETIGADEPIKEVIRRMDEFGYRYLPVLENGRVIGVISTRHLPFGEVIGMQWELEERHALAERMW
jgi:CBS domain-containing protein